jgi:hypothetical protein
MPRIDPFSETGSTGLIVNRGQISSDFLPELRGRQAYKRYNEMRLNSAIVGGMLAAIEQTIRSASWEFISDQGEEDPRIELLEASMDNLSMTWNDHLSEILTMLPFGYSLFEIVYERVGGQILWHKFGMRSQDTIEYWEFDDSGSLAGAHQRAAPKYLDVFLPIEKCLLYRTRVEQNNPEGRSILRQAWVSYYYQRNISQIEGIGIERDLAGLPVIHLPPGSTTDTNDINSDASKAAKIVRNVRNDEQAGLVLPDGWVFELASTGGSRQFDTDKIISRYESRILISTLTQFLMLGQNSVGTQALSQDQTQLFDVAMNHLADSIAEVVTHFAIPRLMALNGYNADGLEYTHSPIGDTNLNGITDFLQRAGSFLTWTGQDENWLRSLARLPEVDPLERQAELDRKQAMADAISQRIQQAQGQPAQDEQPQEDADREAQMVAEMYAAAPPEDTKRRWYESQWKRLESGFFAGQRARVTKGAKGLK